MKKSICSLLTVPGLLTVLIIGVISGMMVGAPSDFLAGLSDDGRGDSRSALASSEQGPLGDSPFTGIAARVAPAVVFIEVKREASEDDMRQFHPGMPFEDMFRQMFPDQEGGRQPMVVPSAGSGFFIDSKGLILTNNHVVRDADYLRVRVSDADGDHTYEAELVGQDPATDVAVIKVSSPKGTFPTLPLGDSDDVQVGDWAIAVGNPFGTLQGTLTVGVVSAKGRAGLNIMGGSPDYQDFIQTDASINFGNSGGPLLNSRGEAIGINTAINPSGQGIGFAIPINIAREVAETLIREGRVVRGFIGILPQELTPELAESMGLRPHQGVLIGNVIPEGPAARAGLESGDVITALAGEKVSDVSRFRMLVARQPVEKSVDVKYLREGKEGAARLLIVEREGSEEEVRPAPKRESWLGIEVEEIAARDAERMGLRAEDAVVVSRVTPGSPADDAGIRQGDVLRKIAGHTIEDVTDYRRVAEQFKDRESPIPFLVERDGMTQFYAVKPRL